jgi:hypothetical protein
MLKLRPVALAATAVLVLAVPAVSSAGPPKNCKPGGPPVADITSTHQKKKDCVVRKEGRMTGHGQVFNYAGFNKVQWEFRNSVCNSNRFPDLKVEFGRRVFKLTSYNEPLTCIDDPALDEGSPKAGFDTIFGQGGGTLDGRPGATAKFRFTDEGEPGVNDRAVDITISDASGAVVLTVTNVRIQDGGNHQAHRR